MALLTIYKALVRSRLDYGSEAFYTAADTQLKRLDTIQGKCLRLACGAMRSTAVNALQQDCGEMPLALRRKRSLLRFAVKVRANPLNPARDVTVYNWRSNPKKYQPGKETIFEILHQYEGDTERVQLAPRPLEAPPWHLRPPLTDLSLKDIISKKDTPVAAMRSEALALLSKYPDSMRIFTDASKLTNGSVAAAFFAQDAAHADSKRLSDSTSIYAAELIAIQMAVDWLLLASEKKQATIISDSLSIVTSLSEQRSTCCPSAMARLLVSIDRLDPPPTFVWVPSHVGVHGNEVADQLAKIAATSEEIQLEVPAEIKDEFRLIDTYVLQLWQTLYNNSDTGAAYRVIEPAVSTKIKFCAETRRKETHITRFRLGKCCLNAYLHEMHCHPDGLCQSCQVPETIEHFLLSCKDNDLAQKLQDACAALSLPPSLKSIFSSPKLVDLVADLVSGLQRKL